MRVSLFTFVAALSTASAFMPVQPELSTSALKVSTSIPGSDPYRKVPIPPTAGEGTTGFFQRKGEVMIENDFFLAKDSAMIAPCLLLAYHPTIFPAEYGLHGAAFHLALAAFLWSQTKRVRCVFGKDRFELFNLSNDGTALREKPSNYVAGTVNAWTYDSITDYGFWPSVEYPLIIYFKETATPKEQWGNFAWWGRLAEAQLLPIVSNGHKRAEGQPHFMPCLMDVKEFQKQMEARGVKTTLKK